MSLINDNSVPADLKEDSRWFLFFDLLVAVVIVVLFLLLLLLRPSTQWDFSADIGEMRRSGEKSLLERKCRMSRDHDVKLHQFLLRLGFVLVGSVVEVDRLTDSELFNLVLPLREKRERLRNEGIHIRRDFDDSTRESNSRRR